jgi:chlorobactene lauroyltransferase
MLVANKSGVFERIFAVYNKNLLRRRFHAFRVSGIDRLRDQSDGLPTIIFCNHTSWWDGLAAFQISRETGLDGFVMMEEKHLKKRRLFRRLGAFSVVRDEPRDALESLRYAVRLLIEDPARTLWIFPQGEILPNDRRPLKFFRGLSRIVGKVGMCQVICLSFRYEFTGEYKPEIFVRIEKPKLFRGGEKSDSKDLTADFEKIMTDNLDRLRNDILNGDLEHYRNII